MNLFNRCVKHSAALPVLLLCTGLYAQSSSSTVTGRITDDHQNPLPGVTVQLYRIPDTTVTAGTISNTAGAYRFDRVRPGRYVLFASLLGFGQLRSDTFAVRQGETATVKTGVLSRQLRQLQEVQVTSPVPKVMTLSNGKLVYHVDQSPAAAGSAALDLLQRMPGVGLGQNENITLNGSANVNVMIDGKMTYLSAQQLSNMLRSMPAENISRIEVINVPSAEFDAAGNAGIIQIITRKSNKHGYAANISAAMGGGHFFQHSENITGNIRTDKFNIFGTLGFNQRHSFRKRLSSNTVSNKDTSTIYQTVSNDPYYSYFYTYKGGIDLYLGKKHQLGFVYTGSLDDWAWDGNGQTKLLSPSGAVKSVIQNHTLAIEPYYRNAFNLNYRFQPDTTGKVLTADIDYIAYRNHSDGFFSNLTSDQDGDPGEPYQELKFHQPSYIDIRSIKTDLDLPLRSYRLKAGLKYASVTIDNNFRYDSLINNTYVYAPTLSDNFIYKEQIAAAYLSAAKQWAGMDIGIGLRLEHTYSNGHAVISGAQTTRRYTNLFPSVSVDRQLGEHAKLGFSISRRINRPSYTDLNPVRYFRDKYAYYTGNPWLKPEMAWIFSLSLSLLDKYIATTTYNRLDNFIDQTAMLDSSGVLITQRANFTRKNRYSLLLSAPVRITPHWDLHMTADLSYTTYPIPQLQELSTVRQWTADLMANQTFSLSGNSALEIMTHYTSPRLGGIYRNRYFFSVDGGYKQTFLRKKLDMRIVFTDLFHTTRYWAYSISNTLQYSYEYIPDSRRLNLTLIWHIGGTLAEHKARQIEEQQRL